MNKFNHLAILLLPMWLQSFLPLVHSASTPTWDQIPIRNLRPHNSLTETPHKKVSTVQQSRQKRHLLQLGSLIDSHTQFSASQLVNHGNWCGLGGNRALDFSITDECDGCCKQHDFCYFSIMYRHRDYFFRNGTQDYENEEEWNESGSNSLSEAFQMTMNRWYAGFWRPCIPYTDSYTVSRTRRGLECGGGSPGPCSRGACQCDVDFVECLRKSRCSL